MLCEFDEGLSEVISLLLHEEKMTPFLVVVIKNSNRRKYSPER